MNLQQFIQWAIAQGQVGNPNQGETYKGQCVSLIQQYINKVYGISWTPRGDAKDWPFNGNVLSYFDKVSNPQAGDIGVMGPNYGGGYGHIYIYTSPNTIIEQNGRVPLRISTGSAYANPIAILRRKGTEEVTDMITDSEKDKVLKMGLHREPLAEELNNKDYNNASLLINTVWNNGGELNYKNEQKANDELKKANESIAKLQTQVNDLTAKIGTQSDDTKLLNGLGEILSKLIVRIGLKK